MQGRALQTGFLVGMEAILGVRDNEQSKTDSQAPVLDVDEADALDQEEGRRRARQRYQHLYWESIPEGESVRQQSY